MKISAPDCPDRARVRVTILLLVYADTLPTILLVVKLEGRAVSRRDECIGRRSWKATEVATPIHFEECDVFILN